jgi:alpha-beta hydrolase superfamily lysophospholipase
MTIKRQLFFIATDTVELASCLYSGQNNLKKTLVILVHGYFHSTTMTEHAKLFIPLAEQIAEKGMDTLLFDFEGHGLSSCTFKDTSANRRIDNLNLVIDWAHDRYDHIILVGFSMGGAASIYCTAERQEIDGLVTWNTVPSLSPTSPSGAWYSHNPDAAVVDQNGPVFLTDRPEIDICDVYPTITCPKLHIQATNDFPGFEAEFAPIFDAALEPKEKILIEGANHPFTLIKDRAILYKSTIEWLARLNSSF